MTRYQKRRVSVNAIANAVARKLKGRKPRRRKTTRHRGILGALGI